MGIIERSHVAAEAEVAPEFYKAGVPASGDFNGQAAKGCRAINTSTGIIYVNTGTKAATVWTVVGAQV